MSEAIKRIKMDSDSKEQGEIENVDLATVTLVEEIFAKEVYNMSIDRLLHYHEKIELQIVRVRSDRIRDLLFTLCEMDDIKSYIMMMESMVVYQHHDHPFEKCVYFELNLPGYPLFVGYLRFDRIAYCVSYSGYFKDIEEGSREITITYHLNDPPVYERQPTWERILKNVTIFEEMEPLTRFLGKFFGAGRLRFSGRAPPRGDH